MDVNDIGLWHPRCLEDQMHAMRRRFDRAAGQQRFVKPLRPQTKNVAMTKSTVSFKYMNLGKS